MWFRSHLRGLVAFIGITLLILGGLTWATITTLQAERDRQHAQQTTQLSEAKHQADKERADLLRQALWRLDARLAPAIAREESRPYPHYTALHSPFPALTQSGVACVPGSVYIPSPLLTAELPQWMSLHIQLDVNNGWLSPQVVPNDLQQILRKQPIELALNNVTDDRAKLLEQLKTRYPSKQISKLFCDFGVTATESPQDAQRWAEINDIIQSIRQTKVGNFVQFNGRGSNNDNYTNPPIQQSLQPTNNPNGNNLTPQQIDYASRMLNLTKARREGQWAYIFDDNRANAPLNQSFPGKTSISLQTVEVELGRLRPVWLPSYEHPEHLFLIRGAKVSNQLVYQGILIDWANLQQLLQDEIADLFPDATFKAISPGEPANPDRTMTSLPVEFEPNLDAAEITLTDEPPGTSAALRLGLGIAWGAALIALLAIAIGGKTLVDLSERRISFVSAVTHELRTPMTTLRLYLDMLSSGMVTDEKTKAEYLQTMNAESDRLNRLIANVLDFARLEKSRPQVNRRDTPVADVLNQIQRAWDERCIAAGKELVIDDRTPAGTQLNTDSQLLEQVISNLIDNAQKYSREAADPRIIVRVERVQTSFVIDVIDHGPGINKRQHRSIFRAFRRGTDAETKAGGVGLGLALATRWASFLGGKIDLQDNVPGAKFRLTIPA